MFGQRQSQFKSSGNSFSNFRSTPSLGSSGAYGRSVPAPSTFSSKRSTLLSAFGSRTTNTLTFGSDPFSVNTSYDSFTETPDPFGYSKNSAPSFQENSSGLEIKSNNGYKQFRDPHTGKWEYVHRRVGEKKLNRELNKNEHVHHIDKNRKNNNYGNLVVLNKKIHQHLHKSEENEINCCFKCGSNSHWVEDCFAKHDVYGREIINTSPNETFYINNNEPELEEQCFKCGRNSHLAQDCFAHTDISGSKIRYHPY